MHMDLEFLLEQIRSSEQKVFNLAHKAICGYEKDVTSDVLHYQVGGIVPEYVKEYLRQLDK